MPNRGMRLDQQQFDALQKRMRGGDSNQGPRRGQIYPRTDASHVAAGAASAKTRSYLESLLAAQMHWSEIDPPKREYVFLPPHKWRIDFAWPDFKPLPLAVEINGAVHRIKSRFDADFEKIQALTLAGWRYLPIGSKDIRTGKAIQLIEQALKL